MSLYGIDETGDYYRRKWDFVKKLAESAKMRRVLVTGSRTWTDGRIIARAFLGLLDLGEPITIVHGACERGADALAHERAHPLGFGVERHPADWKKHGHAAGPIRNREMVATLDPERDLVLAFWDGASKGTLGTIKLARDRGVTVRVYRSDGHYAEYRKDSLTTFEPML